MFKAYDTTSDMKCQEQLAKNCFEKQYFSRFGEKPDGIRLFSSAFLPYEHPVTAISAGCTQHQRQSVKHRIAPVNASTKADDTTSLFCIGYIILHPAGKIKYNSHFSFKIL